MKTETLNSQHPAPINGAPAGTRWWTAPFRATATPPLGGENSSQVQEERLILIIAVAWIGAIALSLAWNWHQAGKSAVSFATTEARASYDKDLVYRRWAALKGGVYAPVSEVTPPNPYLAHLPDRDLATTDGKLLTLVNPAYMTRQVHALGREQYGAQGHITSLKPINPDNSADPWETEALHAFAAGNKEIVAMETMQEQPHLRLMRPLVAEKPCLKCHAPQGYKEGEIRGGMSVSIPFAPYAAAAKEQRMALLFAHLLIGGLGILGLWKGNTMLRSSQAALSRSDERRLSIQAQLQHAQKMEAIGTLAGGIAHDFNNILGAILGYAEMARDDCPVESMIAHDLDQVIRAGNRAKDLVAQILAFSRQAATERIPLQPGIMVHETLKLLRSSLPTTIAIKQEIDMDAGMILADPTQIHQILMNLCTNSFHAMEETGGTLAVSVKKQEFGREDLVNFPHVQPGTFVQLAIKDTGSGIPPEIRDRIFDPYFTTKETGKGTGMGLAIVHGIVESYGGFITCDSRVGEGTVFRINLPVVEKQDLPDDRPPEPILIGTERILFVDDEELLVDVSRNMLERLGYHVTVRTSSLEALNTFKNHPDEFDLVITDQTMPGITGIDLARRMLQIRPNVPIILCTGYSSLISEDKAQAMGIKGFALKPLSKNSISAIIREVLDGGRMKNQEESTTNFPDQVP